MHTLPHHPYSPAVQAVRKAGERIETAGHETMKWVKRHGRAHL